VEGKSNTGKKRGAACLDIKLEDIKKIYRSRGITINQFYFGALSECFYKYIEKRNKREGRPEFNKVPDSIHLAFPMNWRDSI